MNEVAKRIHALRHKRAVVWLDQNQKKYTWLIDYNIHALYQDEAYILRPDIVGENKQTGELEVFVEISDSTLKKDLERKFDLYIEQGIAAYIVVDCKNDKIFQFKNINKQFVEENIFKGMEEIFN